MTPNDITINIDMKIYPSDIYQKDDTRHHEGIYV